MLLTRVREYLGTRLVGGGGRKVFGGVSPGVGLLKLADFILEDPVQLATIKSDECWKSFCA